MNDIEIILGVKGLPKYQADMGKAAQSTNSATTSITNGLKSVAASFGLAFGGAAIAGFLKNSAQAAIKFETLNTQFSVFLGSSEKATKVLADLNKFSIETPFTPDQVNAAGRSLLAFGFTTEKLMPTLRMVGDVSAAVGKDFNELATIYGKARTAGTLFAEDINQLTEAGIPIIEELAKVMGVSADQVKKLGSQGKIHFAELEKAFANMTSTGGRFSGMMDKMSQSTEGLLSTIEGKLQDEMRAIGQAMLPTIRTIAEGFEPAFAAAKSAVEFLIVPIGELLDALGGIFEALGFASEGGNVFVDVVSFLATTTKIALLPLRLYIKAITAIVDAFSWAIKGISGFISKSPILEGAVKVLLGPFTILGKAIGFVTDMLGSSESAAEQAAASYNHFIGTLATSVQMLGGTAAQATEFAKGLKAADFAGLNMAERLDLLKFKFGIFLDEQKKATEVLEPVGTSIKGLKDHLSTLQDQFEKSTSSVERSRLRIEMNALEQQIKALTGGGKAGPKEGSIAFLEQKLSDLQKKFKETDSELNRIAFGKAIEGYQFMLMKFNNEVERMQGLSFLPELPKANEVDGLAASWEKFVNIDATKGMRSADFLAPLLGKDGQNQLTEGLGETTSKFQQFANTVGAIFHDLRGTIKTTFVDAAATIAEGIGNAIATGGSALDVFKAVLKDLLVQVPKLAGMALLNFAATVPGPQSLPIAVAGLALIGLSGLLSGLLKGKEGKSNSIASDIPAPAVQRTQNNSLNAFGASINNDIGQQVADALDGRRMQLVLSDGKQLDAYVKDANKRNNEREGK